MAKKRKKPAAPERESVKLKQLKRLVAVLRKNIPTEPKTVRLSPLRARRLFEGGCPTGEELAARTFRYRDDPLIWCRRIG